MTNMTLHDIIQKNMEEFEKKFVEHCSDGNILGKDSPNEVKKAKSFILSSQLSIIQAIDEWAEREIKEYEQLSDRSKNTEVKKSANGARKSLSDLRSFLNTKTKLQ
jgi:hypothetical protein